MEAFNKHTVLPKHKQISAIPNLNAIFLPFRIGTLKIIDSYAFLGESLDPLAQHLYDKEDKYIYVHFLEIVWKLLCKKGAYPFDWVDDIEN